MAEKDLPAVAIAKAGEAVDMADHLAEGLLLVSDLQVDIVEKAAVAAEEVDPEGGAAALTANFLLSCFRSKTFCHN